MNWKTSLAGVLTFVVVIINIILKLLHGQSISIEDFAALSAGAGLVAAKDHDK